MTKSPGLEMQDVGVSKGPIKGNENQHEDAHERPSTFRSFLVRGIHHRYLLFHTRTLLS
jgi:hypothetical protein